MSNNSSFMELFGAIALVETIGATLPKGGKISPIFSSFWQGLLLNRQTALANLGIQKYTLL